MNDTPAPQAKLAETDISAIFGTNKGKEEEGTWIDIAPGVRIKIRRANSKFCKDYLNKLRKPYGKMQKIPDNVAEQITCKWVAGAILADWEGIVVAGVDQGSYTYEKALKVVTDEKDFREFVASNSLTLDNFKNEDMEDAEGN